MTMSMSMYTYMYAYMYTYVYVYEVIQYGSIRTICEDSRAPIKGQIWTNAQLQSFEVQRTSKSCLDTKLFGFKYVSSASEGAIETIYCRTF